jgi:hypothetical protein
MQADVRHREQLLDIRRATPAGRHFFFGYYDKFATNADDRLLLALNPTLSTTCRRPMSR